MDTIKLIQKYYEKDSESYDFLLKHSKAVTKKALEIAKKLKKSNPKLKVDLGFIKEAAMLHDIGIFLTKAPEIGCYGKEPYVCHGVLGKKILEKENLPKHALICERHIGVGLTKQDIKQQNLPLSNRDMVPLSVEEKIVCLADKFFSKNKENLTKEKTLNEIKKELSKYGQSTEKKLDMLVKEFISST